jgi:hypothetical protein
MHVARDAFSSGHWTWEGGEAELGLGDEGLVGVVGLFEVEPEPPAEPHPAKQSAWMVFATQSHQVRMSGSQRPLPQTLSQS